MGMITVLAPDYESARPETITPASRRPVVAGERAVLTLIDNGKPNARALLRCLADALAEQLPIAAVEVHAKVSAGKTISAEEANALAARSRLVISGVGD